MFLSFCSLSGGSGLGLPIVSNVYPKGTPFEWGGFWWASADIHYVDEDVWFHDEQIRFDSEPSQQDLDDGWAAYAESLEGLFQWDKVEKIKKKAAKKLWGVFSTTIQALVQGILDNPTVTFNQAVNGMEAQFPNSIFDMQNFLTELIDFFDFSTWDDFRDWVLEHGEQLLEEWDT